MVTKNKPDGRTKKERIKKWIEEEREFGRKLKISKGITEQHIRMELAGYRIIAGLDKRGVDKFGYKNRPKIKVIKKRNKNYYTVWKKGK